MFYIDTSRRRSSILLLFLISIYLLILQVTTTTATTKIIRNPYRINEITNQNLKDSFGTQHLNRNMRNTHRTDYKALNADYLQLILDLYKGLPLKRKRSFKDNEVIRRINSHEATDFDNVNGFDEKPIIKNFYRQNRRKMESQFQKPFHDNAGQEPEFTNDLSNKYWKIIRNCRDQKSGEKQEVSNIWNSILSKLKNVSQAKTNNDNNQLMATIKKGMEEKSPTVTEKQDQNDLESAKGATKAPTENEKNEALSKDSSTELTVPKTNPKDLTIEDVNAVFRALAKYDTSRKESSEGNDNEKIDETEDLGVFDQPSEAQKSLLSKGIPYDEISYALLAATKKKGSQVKANSKLSGGQDPCVVATQESAIENAQPESKTLAMQNSIDSNQVMQPAPNNLESTNNLATTLPELHRQLEYLISPTASDFKHELMRLLSSAEDSEHPTVVRQIPLNRNKKQSLETAMVQNDSDEEAKDASRLETESADTRRDKVSANIIFDAWHDDVDLATKASKLFKRVTDEINASRGNILVGGLYDEYKKRLDGILSKEKELRDPYNLQSKSGLRTIVEKLFGEKTTDELNTSKAKIVSKNSVTPKNKKPKITRENESYTKGVDLDKNVEQLEGPILKFVDNKFSRKLKEANDIPETNLVPAQTLQCFSSDLSATEQNPAANIPCIRNALKALETTPYTSLYDEYKTQLGLLSNILMSKQSAFTKKIKRQSSALLQKCDLVPATNYLQGFANALDNVLNDPNNCGANILLNAANKVNMTVMELAERLTQSDNAKKFDDNISETLRKYMDYPVNVPTNYQNPNLYKNYNAKRPEPGYLTVNIPVPVPVVRYNCGTSSQPINIDTILDQLIQRLELINSLKSRKLNSTKPLAVSNTTLDQNCTCVSPMEGTPCDLIGSWESSFLGIRLDIQKENSLKEKRKDEKKINAERTDSLITLKLGIQELVPPREHAFMERLNEWCIGANALNVYGGPLLMVARKIETTVVGTFVGYCRTCGSVDTIFGSWTFHTPSKDCQDITTSIFEKRDLLRRYSMDTRRRERYNALYNKSNFGKSFH